MLSDTYVNEAGEYIRGYWLSEFEDPNNSDFMRGETAWGIANAYGNSIGREVDIINGGQAAGDTYAVPCSRFDFIGPLYENDMEAITNIVSRIEPDFNRTGPSNLLFQRK